MHYYACTAPGPVTNLATEIKFTSVQLNWSPPQIPNGVIIQYEVTYRLSGSDLARANSTDVSTTFTIPSLTPGTQVSEISVVAFTSGGRGVASTTAALIIPLNPQLRKHYSFDSR